MGSITRYPLINSPFLREVKEDNQQLWHAVARLRAIADIDLESEALCRELSMRLQWLREHLAIQFEIEETYGYLSKGTYVNDRYHEQVEKARQGHRWLILALMELSEVVGDLEYKGTLRANLESVVADLKCFLSNLEAHEKLEGSLMSGNVIQPI